MNPQPKSRRRHTAPAAMALASFPAVALAAAFLVLWGLEGCMEADTLGGESPDEVTVGSPPQWDNGIGELLQLKCAVCHQVPGGKLTPAATPQDFDLGFHTQRADGIDGAEERLADIKLQVSSGRMPKEYATPLTSRERQAILSWKGS